LPRYRGFACRNTSCDSNRSHFKITVKSMLFRDKAAPQTGEM
jgi:hypothetical protein